MFVTVKSLLGTVQTALPSGASEISGSILCLCLWVSLKMPRADMKVVCLVVSLEVLLLKAARQRPKAANQGINRPIPRVFASLQANER